MMLISEIQIWVKLLDNLTIINFVLKNKPKP